MPKLWQKGYDLDEVVERFTVGDDPELDLALVQADCVGSVAHAKMLGSIGILAEEEFEKLRGALNQIIALHEKGKLRISRQDEDVHTAVENFLVERLGDLGKKIHAARSRNDQVILDLRIYMRDQLLGVTDAALEFCETLLAFAEAHKAVPMPGRTHFQRAMPSSVGLWAAAFMESLLDDVELVRTAYRIADQCPLGSAASYGVTLPIDRQLVSDLLGFARVQNNVLYVNNSRAKVESIVLSAAAQIMLDLSKLANDVIIFAAPEFGYFSLPEKFCPGSSIMPQKRNPAPFELTRAKAATVLACLTQVMETARGLPSGYNRDFQETKAPLMRGLDVTLASLAVCNRIVPEIEVNEQTLRDAFTPELFATDRALELVQQGVPFRDAYRQVATGLDSLECPDPAASILARTHLGATGNLGLDLSRNRLRDERAWSRAARETWETAFERLLG